MLQIDALLAGAQEHCRRAGRPLVTLSYAQSLDGSLAAAPGRPLALSGPASLTLTHRLRAAHAAILVGIGTVLADDPRLTVRLADGGQPQPVVLDSRLRTPLRARLLSGQRAPWIATLEDAPGDRQAALRSAGARLLTFSHGLDGRVPLPDLLARLASEGIYSLMVEGGAQTLTAFLSQGLADQVVITIAPLFVGGLPALTPGSAFKQFPHLEQAGCERLDEDFIVWGKLC